MNNDLIDLVHLIIQHEQELAKTQGIDFNAVLTMYQILDTEYSRCLQLCRSDLIVIIELFERLYNNLKNRKDNYETYAREMNAHLDGTFPYDDFFNEDVQKLRLSTLHSILDFASTSIAIQEEEENMIVELPMETVYGPPEELGIDVDAIDAMIERAEKLRKALDESGAFERRNQ